MSAIELTTEAMDTVIEQPMSQLPKCPWASRVANPVAVNLNDIMSEQLACSLHVEEQEQIVKDILIKEGSDVAGGIDLSSLKSISSPTEDCNSDMLIAQMLQMQFNKEYDENLKRVEQKYNGSSKVSVSLSNYMASPGDLHLDSDSDEDCDILPPKNWDNFEANEKAFPAMPKCGYVKVNNELVTKHDELISGRRNACRVMESFPPCIHTGDGASFDMQLSNKVYNTLKVYSKAEEVRRNRLHDKVEKSTSEMAIDPKTRLLLYKMINNDILEKVFGIISTGKEAVVLYANGGNIEPDSETAVKIPAECAIKVFKTTLNEFKSRDKYIRDDYRFKDRFSKQNPRKFVHLWAEKEMHNLTRMAKYGIQCPAVVLLKKHILVLQFIGKDMKPAPKLKEVKFPTDDEDLMLISAYQQIVDNMVKLYKECNLVHGDLSEYNILWHEEKAYFIDVSQSVEPSHPHALEFLYRDCTNIVNFFEKKKLTDIHTAESLFTLITGYELNGSSEADVLNQILNYEKNCELLTFAQSEKPFAFEYCWEKSKNDK